MKMILILILTLSFNQIEYSNATDQKADAISSVSVRHFDTLSPPVSLSDISSFQDVEVGFSPAVDPITIIAIGQLAWEIIQEGKPTVNVKTDMASALPSQVADWTELDGWKGPLSHRMEVVYKNFLGNDGVKMILNLRGFFDGKFSSNGQPKDQQRGGFLAGVTVIPEFVDVKWGWDLNAHVSIPTVVNIGTSKRPLAAMLVEVRLNVKTLFSDKTQTLSLLVLGDGTIRELKP